MFFNIPFFLVTFLTLISESQFVAYLGTIILITVVSLLSTHSKCS